MQILNLSFSTENDRSEHLVGNKETEGEYLPYFVMSGSQP
jgi:hypothetical protein